MAGGGDAFGSLRWSRPAADGGVPVDFYLVGVYDLTASPAVLVTSFAVGASWTFTPYPQNTSQPALVNGRVYQFATWAHNAPGGYGAAAVSVALVPSATDLLTGAGERDFFTYDSFGLTDRMGAKVNVGTGNLEVRFPGPRQSPKVTVSFSAPSLSVSLHFTLVSGCAVTCQTTSMTQRGCGARASQESDVTDVEPPEKLISTDQASDFSSGTVSPASAARRRSAS